jgi:hypothetical protein
MSIDPTMASLTYTVITAKLFFDIVRESVVYVEVETLYTMVAAKVERFTFLCIDLTLNHWYLWHPSTVSQQPKKYEKYKTI